MPSKKKLTVTLKHVLNLSLGIRDDCVDHAVGRLGESDLGISSTINALLSVLCGHLCDQQAVFRLQRGGMHHTELCSLTNEINELAIVASRQAHTLAIDENQGRLFAVALNERRR